MFSVSLNWICEILNKNISLDEMMNAFNLQGFEVKEVNKVSNDYLIEIEVKANRPDMLSHYGVARELASFMNIKLPDIKSQLNIDNINENPLDIDIDKNICDAFCIICIDEIDNRVETPKYIKDRLELFNINSINAVVDISNYISIELGQPTHVYDRDKINGNYLNICTNNQKRKFISLDKSELVLEKGDIVICDKEKPINIAGIIGSSISETEKSSKNIAIESASFAKVPIRISSRRLKISSLASFRFERGVDPLCSYEINKILAERILKVCGGKISYHFEYLSDKLEEKKITLRTKRVNSILGTNLSRDEISSSLNKYSFACERDNDNTIVNVPSFRLDIEEEIDLIEEVARSVGYDNIPPQNMNIVASYNPNETYEKFDSLRKILNGFGFNEVINYSFIHEDMQKILDIDGEECIFLQNPLSNAYSLMRPNLVYSLLYSSSYNYSVGNCDISLYEIGRSYIKDNKSQTLTSENNKLAFIISGNRLNSGFNVQKNVKFDFYDMTSYVHNIFDVFNMNYDFEKLNCSFLKNSYKIISDNIEMGFLGEIHKSKFLSVLPNVKLIKNDMFYCELDIDKMFENRKYQKFDSKFPSIVRMYNLVCKKSTSIKDIIITIKECSSEVYYVKIDDVYQKGIDDNKYAILFEVCFWSSDKTLCNDEIESIEEKILYNLNSLYEIEIKGD